MFVTDEDRSIIPDNLKHQVVLINPQLFEHFFGAIAASHHLGL